MVRGPTLGKDVRAITLCTIHKCIFSIIRLWYQVMDWRMIQERIRSSIVPRQMGCIEKTQQTTATTMRNVETWPSTEIMRGGNTYGNTERSERDTRTDG